ncbi:hypothetical protein ACFR99_14455 [Haloarchaeobius amylolyticus]|uniref:Flagellin n=1 Tax=Haloarchaeobius amylolyticus TaxID=1198296 RepID=A0ABD6BJ87_9EURY
MKSTPNGDERGVSDVLAFVLVFAMILGSVVLMSTVGLQAMNDYQEFEQSQNTERAMTSLAANFDDVLRYDGVTERYGELSLRGGTIRSGSSGTNVTINISGTSNPDHEVNLGTFAYESESGVIAYEGGGLVRKSGDGNSIVLKEPTLTCNNESSDSEDTALISLVEVNPGQNRSIQSDGTLGVTITEDERSREIHSINDGTVTVSSETEYNEAWDDIGNDGDDWRCEGVDRVAVTVVTVDIEY